MEDMKKKSYFRVMTIAGSDPSGGAGVQADIKTISACGCYATSAIVALVDENTMGLCCFAGAGKICSGSNPFYS